VVGYAFACVKFAGENSEHLACISVLEGNSSNPATDMVGVLAIFNIRGNRYRLIVRMSFRRQRMYIKEFLTHAEYDKGTWKKWLP